MSIKKMDSKKIEQAIDQFESEVDFELVPVISNRSSYVEHIGWVISLLLLILSIGLIDYYFQDSWANRTIYYVIAPIVSVILGQVLDKSDWVDRFFISKKERTRQVLEKAQRIFFLKRLDQTNSHHALLLYVSVMERKIVILPDPKMKLENLEELQTKILKTVQAAFKTGKYEDGFLNAIEFLRKELKPKFPQTNKNSENQFPNKLIWWDV
ncbi:MAG: hypothetical protein H7256_01845 [Bdellovibrio sp.]|nr:hypothetical protein [Bdellovibrio sp.]